MIIEVFDYEFYDVLGEKVFTIKTNVASKYTFNSKDKERLMTIDNVLFDVEMLEATLMERLYDDKFTVKCITKVIHSDTNKEAKMFMYLNDVKIRSYELGVAHRRSITSPYARQDSVKIVLEINGKDGEVEIEENKDKQAE